MLVPQVCLPGDCVVRIGEIGREMFFISHGSLEVLNDAEELLTVLHTGAYFGEVSLLFLECRTATVCAATYCDLLVLKKESFEKALSFYPTYAEAMKKIAGARRQQTQFHNDEELNNAEIEEMVMPGATQSASFSQKNGEGERASMGAEVRLGAPKVQHKKEQKGERGGWTPRKSGLGTSVTGAKPSRESITTESRESKAKDRHRNSSGLTAHELRAS